MLGWQKAICNRLARAVATENVIVEQSHEVCTRQKDNQCKGSNDSKPGCTHAC